MKAAQPPPFTFQPGRHLQILDDPVHDPYHEREKLLEPAVCTDCGRDCEVPFKPKEGKDVRCTECHRKFRGF